MEKTICLYVVVAWSCCLLTLAGSASQESESDRGYSFPKSVSLKNGATYEYIVVGAGAAGSAAAARLALAGKDVLLVEAGGNPTDISKIPGVAQALFGSSIDYYYQTISNNKSCLSYKNKQCFFSRGKCLGGSTSTNYMMYTRGNPNDYDKLNLPGWSWEEMKPYFLRYEGLQALSQLPASSAKYHNTSGEMKLEFFSDSDNPWHPRIIDGFKELNFPQNFDVNAESQIGVSKVIGYVYDNERMSTARGYLSRKDVKNRLKVAKHTKCTKVIIENKVAKGIHVVHNLRKLKLYATKEVILSAGAIETPHILMHSGIGHADHLAEFDVPVVVDLPVGDNMSDHLLPLVFVKVDKGSGVAKDLVAISEKATDLADLLLHRKGPLTSNGLTDVTAFVNTNCYDFEKRQLLSEVEGEDCELPTTQYIHAYLDRNLVWLSGPLFQRGTGLDNAVYKQLAKASAEYAFVIFSPVVLQPKSLGHVRMGSKDPTHAPAIFPNFLADERDTQEMVRSITIVEHLTETETFAKHNATVFRLELPGCPDYETDHDGYWACYSAHMTHVSYHSAGTTALERVSDADMRVRGISGLRAADLGTLPGPPRGNTAASAIAIGEKVADLILAEHS